MEKSNMKCPRGINDFSFGNIDGLIVQANGVIRLKKEVIKKRKSKTAEKKFN